MARAAIYLHAVVQPGGRIDLPASAGLREGDPVDVVLLTDDRSVALAPPRSLLEVLDSLPKGIGTFTSSREIDTYVRGERDSWE
jgi:hypothetical protein